MSVVCRAKNPQKCRYHGTKGIILKIQGLLAQAKSSDEYFKYRKRLEVLELKEYLESLPKTPLTTPYVTEKLNVVNSETKKDRYSPDETWEHHWVEDEQGNTLGFIKVHVYGTTPQKVSVCDIETNPEFKGTNVALALIRKMKQHFNVPYLQCGDSYSEKGHEMFKKFRGHELCTGEVTLKLENYLTSKEHELSGHNSYSFVESWEDRTPKYRL